MEHITGTGIPTKSLGRSYTVQKALDLYKWVQFELSHRGTRFQCEFSQYCADHQLDEQAIIDIYESDLNNYTDGPVWEGCE